MNRHPGQPAVAPAKPPELSDHELCFPIASGSYGEVWLARNVVGTLRAVKIVRRDQHASIESFEREFKGLQNFEPVSRAHDGLVDILTLGLLPDGAGFYYVMELADEAEPRGGDGGLKIEAGKDSERASGHPPSSIFDPQSYTPRTLRYDLKARGALPADEVIALGLKLTAALAHLHTHGLVHRDVKPSNILFIGGEPKLADAGLVAAVDDARSLVGTAGYIAPEGPGTPQADLYALGKVLYEVAFGKDRQEFPALPADVASRPDHPRLLELNAILLKACATDRRERYQSADQMRADFELLPAGRSVKRRQAWNRILHHAKKLTLAASVVALVSAIIYGLAVRWSHPSGFAQSGQLEFKWSTNEDANEEFRKGMRALHTGGSNAQAIQYFERSTALDPKFADAYAVLARAWSAGGDFPNMRVAAYKAVSLNTNSVPGNSVLATVKLYELDWSGAEGARLRAIAFAPNSEDVLLTSALDLAIMGRPKEALAELEKARSVAPASASRLRTLYSGLVFSWAGEFDRALDVFNQSDSPRWQEQIAQAYLGKEDYPNAIRFERKAALEEGGEPVAVNKEFDALENAYHEGGKKEYWTRKLEVETPKTGASHWMQMAAIHARLKEPEKAFEYLRQAREKTPVKYALGLLTNPSLQSLREDQRFRDLVAELWRKK